MPSGILGARAFPDGCIGDLTLTAATPLRDGMLELPSFHVAVLHSGPDDLSAHLRACHQRLEESDSRAGLTTRGNGFRRPHPVSPLGSLATF
jgi:hypothetical protein